MLELGDLEGGVVDRAGLDLRERGTAANDEPFTGQGVRVDLPIRDAQSYEGCRVVPAVAGPNAGGALER